MHKIYLSLFLVLGSFLNAETPDLQTNTARGSNGALLPVTPSFQYSIKPSDLNHDVAASGSMKKIQLTGRYYISQNLLVAPENNNVTAIHITTSNVTLDMNYKTIERKSRLSKAGTGLIAIKVDPNLYNVKIINGYVQGVNHASQTITTGITVGTGCRAVDLTNISISQCSSTGMSITGANSLNIENCSVSLCSGSAALNGLSLSSCNDTTVKDCLFNGNTSSNGNVNGVSVSSCTNISFDNCHADRNNTTSTGGKANGFSLSSSPVVTFSDCSANSQSSVANDTIGFDVQSGCHSCVLKNCNASNNQAASAAKSVYGFKIADDNNYLENCTSNKNSSSSIAYGMHLSSSDNNRMVNSQTNNNSSVLNDCYGVYLDTCTNTSIINSQSKGNTSNTDDSVDTKVAVGYYSTAGQSNVFEGCVANGQSCTGTAGSTSQHAAGFKLSSSESFTQIIDCEASGNNGASGSDARAYGIFISGTSGGNGCYIKNCKLIQNTTAAGRQYGFYNGTTLMTTTLLGNLSIGHGQCLVSATLDGSNSFIDTENSGMNYFYTHNTTTDDPRNVISEAPRHNILSISISVDGWENISLY